LKEGKIMEKYMFHQIVDSIYIGMVSVLDYEISLKKCLAEISFSLKTESRRKILVDMALKCGINQYRFVEMDVNDDGKILWNSSAYIIPNTRIVNLANAYLREKKEIVKNSMLSKTKKKEVLNV
jgi:hypothetical protein